MNDKKTLETLIGVTRELQIACDTEDLKKSYVVLDEMKSIVAAWPTHRQRLRRLLLQLLCWTIALAALAWICWLLLHEEIPPLDIVETWRY